MPSARPENANGKFMRQLLTATCLTAASASAAHATLVTESTDFGNSFADRTLLPAGTDVVTGHVGLEDDDDFFQLSGLTPLATFHVAFAVTAANGFIQGEVLDSGDDSLGSGPFDTGMSLDIAGTVPADGILVLRTTWKEGGPYQVTVSGVPEPSTHALVASALGALGWRRRHQKP